MKGKNAKKETEKDKGKKDNSQKGKGKNDKNKKKIEEEEEEIPLPPPEKPYNLERFIYVTTYYDSSAMQKIKELFEEINQQAFQLRSVKEIYTRNLSDEERDNNEIDYISGVQLLDKNIRITLIEGITEKAMAKIKEKLPKYQMNCNTFMVFSDKNVLFNKRIYSKFDLSLKYIKLRDTLQSILTTFPIYMKADKYREIYNAFLNFGSILKSRTMKEIAHAELFSDADALLTSNAILMPLNISVVFLAMYSETLSLSRVFKLVIICPSFKKRLAISTALSNKPPGLFLKSIIIPFTSYFCITLLNSSTKSLYVLCVK